MKIPTYESNVGTSGRVVYQDIVKPPGTRGLDEVIKGLGSIYEFEEKKRKEDVAIADFTNKSNANLELTRIGAELQDGIQQGGDYSKALETYDKQYQKIVQDYGSKIIDKGNKAEALAGWERTGLENTLRLKDVIRAKQKEGAVAAADNTVDLLVSQISTIDEADLADTVKKVGEQYGSIPGMPPALGQMKTRQAVQNGIANRVKLTAQNNPNDPQVALDELEKYQKDLDIDAYVSMRGQLVNRVEARKQEVGAAANVEAYIANPLSTAPPSQKDVDVTFNTKVLANAQNMSAPEYEGATIALSRQTQKVPSAVSSQAAAYLGTYKENMTDGDIAATASTARVVAALGSDEQARGGSNAFSAASITKADLIVSRMNAGMDERTAVETSMKNLDSKVAETIYNAAKTETMKKWYKDDKLQDVANSLDLPRASADLWQSEYIDKKASAMALGASSGEAEEQAAKLVRNKYSEFNGKVVTYAPNKLTPYTEKQWVEAGNKKYAAIMGSELPKDAKIILAGDRDTMQEKAQGVPADKLSFPIMVDYGTYVAPIVGKDGRMVRVTAGAQAVERKANGFETLYGGSGGVQPFGSAQ